MIESSRCVLLAALLLACSAGATDAPHGPPRLTKYCLDCHTLHNAPGTTLTAAAGNHNLCMSCHNPTGLASAKPFASADQAVPGTQGTSHRFDALAVNAARETLLPLNPTLALSLAGAAANPNKRIMCSTCHNQHSQEHPPPDLAAPPYVPGDGWGRHYQRIPNDVNQACLDCHRLRDVSSSAGGSHPVRVTIPASSTFQPPPSLVRIGGQVLCTTCHSPHYATSGGANGGLGDGYLLDDSIGNLCYQCHTLGDRVNASHLKPTGVLWPGGQYGSTRPAAPAGYRGYCVNCHWPHGATDDGGVKFPKLWVERYDTSRTPGADPDDAEDLCFTCHDGTPASTNVQAEFARGTNTAAQVFHHPVKDSEQLLYSRAVECVDCHNPHQARASDKHKGVTGVDLAGNALGPGTANNRDLQQYELCFKCHGNTRNAARTTTNKRLDFQAANSAFHPVAAQGQNQSAAINAQLQGGLSSTSTIKCTDCHNNPMTRFVNGVSGAYALGPAINSSASPKGPHGADQQRSATQSSPFILRAYFNTGLTGPSTFNADEFRLCFLCHGQTQLMSQDYASGARTNFYQNGGKANLHWVHLDDRSSKAVATCRNCHFNIHSNRQTGAEGSAHTTQYTITIGAGTTTYSNGPPQGVKTRNVSFSSDVTPNGGRAKPEWRLNTTTRQRTCNLNCHGTAMNQTYTPSGTYDTDALTYVACADVDGDTYFGQSGCGTAVDCNDGNPAINPGATEASAAVCTDAADNDCDTLIDCAEASCFSSCCHDVDGDTYFAEPGCGTAVDCNDGNPAINPAIVENTVARCADAVDNNCNSLVDCNDSQCMGIGSCPTCTDGDGDTYYLQSGCGTPVDCNDGNPAINPGVAENTAGRCADALDNDCNALVDCADTACAAFWTNADGDGYYAQPTVGACLGGDCLDSNANVNPGRPENTCALCRDGLDNNCGGGTDLVDPACAQQTEDLSAECSNGADNDGDGKIDCHDNSCWSGAACGGNTASVCVAPESGNNRRCCRPAGTKFACYRTECNGVLCDQGGPCDVY